MTSPDEVRTVTVLAHVPDGVTLGERSVLRARIEDSSIADRAPTVVSTGETSLREAAPGSVVRLELEVPAGLVDERSSYSVFVHLDAAGSGEVEAGDALTVQTVPVLTRGAPDEARAELRQVG